MQLSTKKYLIGIYKLKYMYNECTFLHECVVFDKTDHKAKKK